MFKENTASPEEFIKLLKKSNVSSKGIILQYPNPFIYPEQEFHLLKIN